ncbi:hypothetical protein SAMN05421863_10745 [Nitrosomonas communis]|uniref:Uncharacterized protein n=1 Tax=Nitrosomonas communis TaxID=44574 RepID=A0A1I4V0J5_9PROT|nr:hypothetical protein SAMN05421863_10745 [Nitrosomonas communis]
MVNQYRNMIMLMVIVRTHVFYAASCGELNPKEIKRNSLFLIRTEDFGAGAILVRANVLICTDYCLDGCIHHPKIIFFG